MKKVRKLIDAGAPISDAIVIVLKIQGFPTIASFANKYGRDRSNITHAINGTRRASEADIEALIGELGGTPEAWRDLLHEAGKPGARRTSDRHVEGLAGVRSVSSQRPRNHGPWRSGS